MTDNTLPAGLWQETRRAAEAWDQARGPREDGLSLELVGQVLILPELGESRLAWAVLRGEDELRLLVAADVNPLVGSADVPANGPAVGSLTLRCRFAVWVNERQLGAATLLGTLPPDALSHAESRRQAIEAGRSAGTFSQQETEEDPEYQDWIEDVVRPTVAKLEAQAGADAPELSPAVPFPTLGPTERRPSPRGVWIRWAAVLALVALGAAGGWFGWRQAREIAGLRAAAEAIAAAHRQAIVELEARRAELEAQYQARLREAGEDRAQLESEHRAKMRELEAQLAKLRQATEVKNPVIAILEAAPALRGPTKLIVGPEASHLVFVLSVDDPAGTEFQIEVHERSSGKRVLVQMGLRADVLGEVRLGLPAVLLPPGDYRLRLFRKEAGGPHLVREHGFDIEKEPAR